MKFCSKCGTVLNFDKKRKALTCPNCGAELPIENYSIYPKGKSRIEDRIIIISEKERNLRTDPEIDIECPNCGNNRAYFWMVQTRGADESATQFFRCTKCGHTWREYS